MAECTYVDSMVPCTKAFAKSRAVIFSSKHPFNLEELLRNSVSREDELHSGLESNLGKDLDCASSQASSGDSASDLSCLEQASLVEPAVLQPSTSAPSPCTRRPSLVEPAVVQTPGSTSTPSPSTRKREGDLSFGHRVRKKRRLEHYAERGHVASPKTIKEYVIPSTPRVFKTFDTSCLPATQGAYGAKSCRPSWTHEVHSIAEAKELGLKIHPWNGLDPEPFVDQNGVVFMVLAGRPKDATYDAAAEHVFQLMEMEGQAASFSKSQADHRRGRFPALNVGVTHGMGTLCPTFLDNGSHTQMLDRLLADSKVQRLAGFASSAFSLWAPGVYNYYKENLDKVFTKKPRLRRIFKKSIFPAAALNFGPHVCTKPHCDCKNCPFGMCAVQALGKFDPEVGGHLILWELGIAVEFPPGSTILLPSATITHSNIHIRPDESRASFTQYCSGGLFRWVDYNYQTEKELCSNDPALYKEICELRPERWRMGLGLLSTIKQLKKTDGEESVQAEKQ